MMARKWAPPPDHATRRQTGRPALISAITSSKLAALVSMRLRWPTLFKAVWSVLETLHGPLAPVVQQSVRPSSPFATEHWVHPVAWSKYAATLVEVAAQHQFDWDCACMLKLSRSVAG